MHCTHVFYGVFWECVTEAAFYLGMTLALLLIACLQALALL